MTRRILGSVVVALMFMVGSSSASIFCASTNSVAAVTATPLEIVRQCCTTAPFSSARRIAIFFNAECSVDALDFITFVDTDIQVDGVEISPTIGNDNALCTSRGRPVLDGWVSAETNAVAGVGVGPHTICVTAQLLNFSAGDSFRLDDSTLIVMD